MEEPLYRMNNKEQGTLNFILPGYDANQIIPYIELPSMLSPTDRAIALTCSPMFKEWLSYPKSSALLVNGDMIVGDRDPEKPPFARVIAMLMQRMDSRIYRPSTKLNGVNVFYVGWFCDRHGHHDPSMIMVSFVTQLLLQVSTHTFYESTPRFDLREIPDLDESFENGHLDQWYEFFLKLVALLPAKTALFCMIDNITFRNKPHNQKQEKTLDDIVGYMLGLARWKNESLVFKLLVTAPLKELRWKGNAFEYTETLELQKEHISDVMQEDLSNDINYGIGCLETEISREQAPRCE